MRPSLLRPSPGAAEGSRASRSLRVCAATATAIGVFGIDTFTPLSSAVAVLYVFVLPLVGEALGARRVWATAAGCAGLAAVSFVSSHGLDTDFATVLRLLVSLAAITIGAVLVRNNALGREALASQARLLDLTTDALLTRDATGRVTFWNKGAEHLYGWTGPEILGRDAHESLESRLDMPLAQAQAELLETGVWEGEIQQRRRDGGLRIVLSRWLLERDAQGRPDAIFETNTDITGLKRVDQALRESEARYRTIFNTLAIAIWEHDMRPVQAALQSLRASGVDDIGDYLRHNPDFVARSRAMVAITDVNERGLQMMGFAHKDEFFAQLDEMLLEDDASFEQFLVAAYEGQPRFEAQSTVRSRTGALIPIVVGITFPLEGGCWSRVQASIFNLTDQRRMQERLDRTRAELEQALRAATLGALSASIAHEVNQPVAAASNYTGAARRWLAQAPPNIPNAQQALHNVTLSLERAADVVKSVGALIGRTPPDRVRLRFDELVSSAARQISHELTEHQSSLVLDLQAPDATLSGDRVLLQQVMINLMVNAAQAMGQAGVDVRRLTVRTRQTPGEVVVDILDTGPGFTSAATEQAFQAFFSTKSGGMGLGLAICRSAVQAHEGAITLHPASSAGGGLVTLRLPIDAEPGPGRDEASATV
jgi:PAS domain S-box-containing protein